MVTTYKELKTGNSELYLLGVLKLPPETLIHSFGGLLRAADHGLDVDLKAAVQKLIYLPVIIVIIPEEGGGKRSGAST